MKYVPRLLRFSLTLFAKVVLMRESLSWGFVISSRKKVNLENSVMAMKHVISEDIYGLKISSLKLCKSLFNQFHTLLPFIPPSLARKLNWLKWLFSDAVRFWNLKQPCERLLDTFPEFTHLIVAARLSKGSSPCWCLKWRLLKRNIWLQWDRVMGVWSDRFGDCCLPRNVI